MVTGYPLSRSDGRAWWLLGGEFGEVRSRGDEVRLADPTGQAAECSGGQLGPLVPPQSSLQHRPQQRAAALGGT